MADKNPGSCEELSRRKLLQSGAVLGATAGAGVGTSAFAGTALADAETASNREITVRQGGEVVATVTPYDHDMNVQTFYNYSGNYRPGGGDGASANTPSDVTLEEDGVSQLLFHEHEGDLSLVVIHDAPNSSSGGSVRLEFDGLPDGGEWAVEDDPTHAPDEYDSNGEYAKWRWGRCCTDGGAYRWSADGDVEITVTPREYSGGSGDPFGGIHTWKLRSADGQAETLSPDQPVTISVGEADQPADELESLIDEKSDKISAIRGTVPGDWESDRSRIDTRAEQFLDSAEDVRDTGTQDEREQYEEALARLNDSEELMLDATRGPLLDIIPKTATLVIKAALALATEGITRFAKYNVKDRALKFVRDRILGNARAVKDRTFQHFPTGELSPVDPDELGTLFDEGYFTLARFFDETIGRDPDAAEEYFEEVTASGIVVGGFGVGKTAWGDDLLEAVEEAYEKVKTGLNAIMYKLYYFDVSSPSALDVLPDFSLPSDVDSYSIDVPDWISSISDRVPDEITVDADLPVDQFDDTVSDLDSAVSRVRPYLNVVDFPTPDVGGSGINSAMEDSVDALAEDAEAGRLDDEAREARSEAASAYGTILEGASDVFSTAFWIYGKLSNALEVTTVAAFAGLIGLIGTAMVVGTEASLLLAGATVGTAISQLLSILYILGWVELIFIAAQGLTLVAAVLLFQKTFATGTLVVNNVPSADLEGI